MDEENETAMYIYDNLSILYTQHSEESIFNQRILKTMTKTLHTSIGMEDTLNKYIHFKEINGFFFDLLIIDNRFGLDVCYEILKINPTQKIIIKVRLDNNQNLSTFHVNEFDDFIYEPLSKLSIEKTIRHIMEKADYKNLLALNLDKQNKSITDIVSTYEDKLYDSQRKLEQRSEFFASMSHEIRTPMNAIIGMSRVLMQDKNLDKGQIESVTTINRASNMLLTIINDILDFSKIEAGKISFETISFDLNMILNYLADMVSITAQEKGIKLTFEMEHSLGKNYLGDPLRISQILLNLLSNAIKFTKEGGVTLRIRTIESDAHSALEFEVSDTGIGLSQEQIANLFQSYNQASAETSRKYGGTGLGLTISKKLVEMMEGKIWVESEYGKGATFFVNITLKTAEDENRRRYRLPSRDIMQMEVLIIDANKESSASLANLIHYFHLPLQSASTKEDAQILMQTKKFDILFVDKEMYNLLDIKAYKTETKVNVVLIENWTNLVKNERLDYAVIDEIIKRPFHQQRVYEILSSIYNMGGIGNNKVQLDKYNKEDIKALGKHNILIAEDNKINQKVMSGLLSGTELEITFADDGQETITLLQENKRPYALIFMDINMPNLDGYMATQIIRKNSTFDAISIVGLSAHGGEKDIQKAKSAGMDDYLSKPIDVKALYAILLKYLSHPKN